MTWRVWKRVCELLPCIGYLFFVFHVFIHLYLYLFFWIKKKEWYPNGSVKKDSHCLFEKDEVESNLVGDWMPERMRTPKYEMRRRMAMGRRDMNTASLKKTYFWKRGRLE